MKLLTHISIILFLLIFPRIEARDMNLKNYNIKDGLIQSQVYSLVQDKDGYLWIGTAAGLSRFDGKNFVSFHRVNGLGGNVVRSSFKDRDGNLWFGHYSGKLTKYSLKTRKFSAINLPGSSTFQIQSIVQDTSGNLWVGTDSRGIFCKVDGKWTNFTVSGGLKSNYIYEMEMLSDGSVMVGFDNGLMIFYYDPNTQKLKPIDVPEFEILDNYFVNDLELDNRKNDVWIATEALGLIRISNIYGKSGERKITKFGLNEGLPVKSIKKIKIDDRSRIWIALRNQGLLIADINDSADKLKKIKYLKNDLKISENRIASLYNDREGNIWIGTNGSGLFQYLNTNISINFYDITYKHTSVWGILEDKNNNLWLGLEGAISYGRTDKISRKGLNYLTTLDTGTKGKKQVIKMIKDDKGELYFISWANGIFKLDKHNHTSERFIPFRGFPQQKVNSFLIDGNYFWFVTEGLGAIQYNMKTRRTRYFNFFDEHPEYKNLYEIFKDSKGNYWFGSYTNGVLKYDGENFEIFDQNNGFPLKSSFLFEEDKFGNIWFVSYNSELVRYDGKIFTDFSFAKGLDGKPVYTIINYDSAIWITTPTGLSRFNPADTSFSNYLTKYGFEMPETNTGAITVDSKNNLWIGTVEGAIRIRPKTVKQPDFSMPLFIDKVQVFFKDIPYPKDHRYQYRENYLTFNYQAITLVNANEVKYSYILEGYDESWSPPFSENKVTYSNLPPGEYVFKVKAINSFGRWVDQPATYKFKIMAPFWLTWQFILLLIILTAFLLFGLYRRRVTKLKKYSQQLEKEVQKRVSELSEEKERLSVTLGSITNAVITTDTSGKIMLLNRVAEQMCGCLNSGVTGKKIDDIFKIENENSESLPNLYDEMLPENYEKTLEKEGILINSENKKIYIEYTNSAIHDDKGEIAGFVFVFRDITEKKRMTEELLKNKKLESIGVLAGGIAHDFNNILTAVVGNLSLAKMELDPDSEVYNWIDLSERSSLRATNLTKQLLTFSKGGSPIKSSASIDKLIEETATFILRGSNVTFRTRFEKGLPKINMDSGQISQVIQNLIFNAQKAMPDGGTIEIEVKNKNLTGKNLKTPLKTGKYLEITIKDEGTGISKEHIDKIFDPFYTTDNSSSGLGLSIAYSIIKNHNGSISVKSTPGKGAAFTIYLPATSAHTEEEKEETSSSKMISGRGRILVMDDENEVLKVASGILKSMGYEVITAKDGNSAIRVYSEHLENNPFTAVIMDLTIPGGMGGKEAVKELLKLDSNAVVFVSSGYSNDPVMAEFQKYGFKGRIKKPYNLNEISLLLSGLDTA